MKRKWIIIVLLLAVTTAGCMALLKTGKKYINSVTKVTTVVRGTFQKNHKSTALVTSGQHHQFFNGYITSLSHDMGELVEQGEVILEYTDVYNHKQQLKAAVKGYITDINSTGVTISDLEYYLTAQLPQEVMSLVEDGEQCLFESTGKQYLATVTEKNMYGRSVSGRTLYQLSLSVENTDDLHHGQKGILTIPLTTLYGVLIVDRKAIYETRDGFYLLPADWLAQGADVSRSLIRVEVLDANDEVAMINAAAIEELEVCVIDDFLREFLSND